MAETPPTTAEATAAAAEESNMCARGSNYNRYRPLHKALLQGDWKKAGEFFDRQPGALTENITPSSMTALHVAAASGQWGIVEKLEERMQPTTLEARDSMGYTALHYVSMGGSTRVAKALVRRKPSLTNITDSAEQTALLLAITSCRKKKLVRYLALDSIDGSSTCPFSDSAKCHLVAALTAVGYHDITLDLVQRYSDLATVSGENGNCILYALSRMPSEFPSGNDKLGIWSVEPDHSSPSQTGGDVEDPRSNSRNHQYYFGSLIWTAIDKLVPCVKILRYQSAVRLVEHVCSEASIKADSEFWQSFGASNILSNAASCGNVEIIRICSKFFPDLVWNYIPNIVQVAIKKRQEKVFSLVCKIPICKSTIMELDESRNTTSHLAAMLSPSSQPKCSALQLQKDLQWFKAVESLDHPFHKEAENEDGKTPWQLFREEHKGMLEKAEKWMKITSTSCMLVAALIATVAFTASITIPGGTDQKNGYPVLWGDTYLTIFAVSDTLALFSSLFSLMAFLSILIAPYSEEDFLVALPVRLILGVAALLFALLSTMVAFAIAVSFLFVSPFIWLYLMILVLVILPVHIFRMLQLPLILKMTKSTYGPGICSREFVLTKRSKFIRMGSSIKKVWKCGIFS